jgi:hypothetical protein
MLILNGKSIEGMNSLKAAKALLRKEIKLKVAALTENEKQRQSKIVVEKVYILKERNILQCIYVLYLPCKIW